MECRVYFFLKWKVFWIEDKAFRIKSRASILWFLKEIFEENNQIYVVIYYIFNYNMDGFGYFVVIYTIIDVWYFRYLTGYYAIMLYLLLKYLMKKACIN